MALGLSLAHDIPIFGIPSIATLAAEAMLVGYARRGSFYHGLVREHQLAALPEVLEEDAFRRVVEETELPVFTTDPEPPLGLSKVIPRIPQASDLARCASLLSPEERANTAALPLEPLYIR
ncbi:MAG: hypothetical protein AAGJ31_16290, partial [Verrucomicrobiota bacterium]